MNLNVKIETLQDFQCPTCMGIFFREVKRIKLLTAIQSPNGQAGLIPIPVLECTNCETISDPLNPPKPKKEIIL